ncbi:MAG TPA: cell division protein SepF [Clostridiales bacterium]|nr:cell division protein SepF [Clostridiales bacterium]
MAKLFDKVLNLVGWELEEEPEDGFEENEESGPEAYKPDTNEERPRFSFSTNASRKQQSKVVNIHSSSQLKVVVIQPHNFEDAQDICNHLKDNKPVIVNLESMEKEPAQRIVDFFCGSVYALDGSIYKVSSSIFLITPYNVDVMGEFKDELKNKGVFPWMK